MATHNLAVIIKNPSDDGKFLLVKQTPPPKFGDEEYDSYVDSDLWDLPSTQLSSLEGESQTRIVVEGEESCLEKLDLSKFDLNLALNQVLLTSINTEYLSCSSKMNPLDLELIVVMLLVLNLSKCFMYYDKML